MSTTIEPEFRGEHSLGQSGVTDAHLVAFALPADVSRVEYFSDEVTSMCPITKQPDFYTVEIALHGRYGIESKSLKLYLQSFRDRAQFAEALAQVITDDVMMATDAGNVMVTVTQKSRGGVSIKAYSDKYAVMDEDKFEEKSPVDGHDDYERDRSPEEYLMEQIHRLETFMDSIEQDPLHRFFLTMRNFANKS